jgi:hypothetical protein
MSLALALCALGAYGELGVEVGPAVWVRHEYPSDQFPVVYNRNIHRGDFYGGCSVRIWSGNTRIQIEGRDNRWHGKQLVQKATFTKNVDGTVVSSRPIPTETYIGEYDEKTGERLPTRKGEETKNGIHLSLPIAGYDVFEAHCVREVASLPPDVLKVFQDLYRPSEIKQ